MLRPRRGPPGPAACPLLDLTDASARYSDVYCLRFFPGIVDIFSLHEVSTKSGQAHTSSRSVRRRGSTAVYPSTSVIVSPPIPPFNSPPCNDGGELSRDLRRPRPGSVGGVRPHKL